MIYSLILKSMSGSETQINNCIAFKFEKEVYSPYSIFEGTFFDSYRKLDNIAEVIFKIGSNTVFHGLLDSLIIAWEGRRRIVKIKAKSFTSLICQNEIEPGLKYNVTLSTLISEFITIPYLTYESNETDINYVYIKENSTLWDAVSTLAMKLFGKYPYIQGTNCLRITPISNPQHKTITQKDITACGAEYDYSKIISDLHMQDIEGNYGAYNKINLDAHSRKIVRHKHIPLDHQFLNNPDIGLTCRLNYSMRGFCAYFGECFGYTGEDINDLITVENFIDQKRISYLKITGKGKIVKTKYGVYSDKFNN